MPSASKLTSSFKPSIIHFNKVYTAVASIYVDGVLYGQIDVTHGDTVLDYVCDFDKAVLGSVITIEFNRNTYVAKGGQYYSAASYSVSVNEIIPKFN